jgi:hypothetical protein
VRAVRQRFAAGTVEFLLGPALDEDVRALRDQRPRGRKAEAGGAAGDDECFSVETADGWPRSLPGREAAGRNSQGAIAKRIAPSMQQRRITQFAKTHPPCALPAGRVPGGYLRYFPGVFSEPQIT